MQPCSGLLAAGDQLQAEWNHPCPQKEATMGSLVPISTLGQQPVAMPVLQPCRACRTLTLRIRLDRFIPAPQAVCSGADAAAAGQGQAARTQHQCTT